MFVNGVVLTMDLKNTVIRDGCVVVEDDRIIDVGKYSELKNKYHGYEKFNCNNKIVMPPFINCHTHASMTLLRGYADDLPLFEWLTKWIFPVEKTLTPSDIYLGTRLAVIESALSGVSCLNTMYYFMDMEAEAISQAGLRGVVGHVCFSNTKKQDASITFNLVKKWHKAKNGLIRVSVDPHSVYTVDPVYLKELYQLKKELNDKYGSVEAPIKWHIHTAETADELVKMRESFSSSENSEVKKLVSDNYDGVFDYLNRLNVLDEHIVAAHCVHLTDRDISLIREKSVNVVHNPVSNLKLASGVSPLPKLLNNKINVSLGTDGPCSNNSLDMFETVKITALLHKGVNLNPTVLPAHEVIKMATINGARTLGWDSEIGSIEKGKKADLLIIDLSKPHATPLYNEFSQLVYALKSSDVDSLLVNGRFIIENKVMKTVNVEDTISKVVKWVADRFPDKSVNS
ncbi:MAG: amidohydrolase [Candidatus Odinarchaeum yellowstonii]|uniref:Amidohydrolase n=1 Tax=Odinarchaeota yellowstonii (strain LCB_4) TaxID=1841599 RepID=A0AAF0IC83_ODILC|nr:MAG: amidohydrolase [Candidatus Odinarchaeum yellowstonii]